MITNSKLPAAITQSSQQQSCKLTASTTPVKKNRKNSKIHKNITSATVLQKSLYDWDSPSSSTGTIKRSPSSSTVPGTSTSSSSFQQIAASKYKTKLLSLHKNTTTTTKGTGATTTTAGGDKRSKQNSKFQISESLLKNNLKGRTKNQITKTNSKLQKFNQNNKVQQQKQQQEQSNQFSTQESSSRSDDSCGNKKFIKSIKTVKLDNIPPANDDDNNDVVDDDDVYDVTVNSNECNLPSKGIVSLNGLKNQVKFSTKLTTVKNSFCEQKSKQLLLPSAALITSVKSLNENHFNTRGYNNGNQTIKDPEAVKASQLRKRTKTIPQRTIRKSSIDFQKSDNNLELLNASFITEEAAELKRLDRVGSCDTIIRSNLENNNKNVESFSSCIVLHARKPSNSFKAAKITSNITEITIRKSRDIDFKPSGNIKDNSSNFIQSESKMFCIKPAYPPPYRYPPEPPTPPPINQIPTLRKNHSIKFNEDNKIKTTLEKSNNKDKSSSNNNCSKVGNSPSHSKGSHLSELKNCISKLNSKFSLTSAFSKVHLTQGESNEIKKLNLSSHIQPEKQEKCDSNTNEYIICNCPLKKTKENKKSPEDLNKILILPKFTSNQFKNIPVRPRKGPKHLDNYCLFDPSIDFISEKKDEKLKIDENCSMEVEETKKQSNEKYFKNVKTLNNLSKEHGKFLDYDRNNIEIPIILDYNSTQHETHHDNIELIMVNDEFIKEIIHNDQFNSNEFDFIDNVQHNYSTIDPEKFKTDFTSVAPLSSTIELNPFSIASNLQTMHVQNQFSSLKNEKEQQSIRTIAKTAQGSDFPFDDKHDIGIQITVNKDNNISKDCLRKKHQQEQLQPEQQPESNCSKLPNTIIIEVAHPQHNNSIHSMTADSHSKWTVDRKQLDQQQNLRLNDLTLNKDDQERQKQQQQQQYYLEPKNISINRHYHHYPSLDSKNFNNNNISIDSAIFTDEKNSKIHLKSLKRIQTKLGNANGIKPELNKCLLTLKNSSYYNSYDNRNNKSSSNSNTSIKPTLKFLQLHRSMEEIFRSSRTITNENYYYHNNNNHSNSSSSSRTLSIESNLHSRQFSPKMDESNILTKNKNNFSGSESHKIYCHRKTRPLSTNISDDGDSGVSILSPNSSDELKFNSDIFWDKILLMESMENIQGYIEVYIDWANYYLERAKSTKRINDLSIDCRDALLLADIIETVTNFRVINFIKNPKSQEDMIKNIQSCLTAIASIDGIEEISAHDIFAGSLKSILALFFALSRFKHQLKQKSLSFSTIPINSENLQHSSIVGEVAIIQKDYYNQQEKQIQQPQSQCGEIFNSQPKYIVDGNRLQNENNMEMLKINWQKSVPYAKSNGTAIPLPATVLVQRRCPPDKVRPLPPTPNHVPSIPGLGKTGNSGSGSLNNSPINNRSHISLQLSPQKITNNGLRPPQCKIPSSPFASPKMVGHSTTTTITANSNISSSDKPPPLPAANPPAPSKHSMLDKFKLFKTEKSCGSSNSSTKSERTSSSSGFSSARSERSDSSSSLNHITSLNTKLKPPSKISTISNESSRAKEAASKKYLKPSISSEKNTLKQVKEKSPVKLTIKDEKPNSKLQKNSIKNSSLEQDKGKLHSKTSSSDSLKANSGMVRSNSTTLSNNSSIPKPMAAIKGQTKSVQMNGSDKSNNSVPNDGQKDISKNNNCDTGVISPQYHHNSEQLKTHIVRPLPTHPLQHNNAININNGCLSGLNLTSPTNSIVKNCEIERNCSSNAATNTLASGNIKNSKSIGVGSQTIDEGNNCNECPISNKSPAKKSTGVNQNTDTSYEEEQPIIVTPMKPLLEGYNSHVTILPARSNQKIQYLITEYTTADIDIGQGYMSDGGESFRRVPVLSPRFLEIDNGYLSDGNIGGLNHLQQQQQLQQQHQHQLTPLRGKQHFLNGLRGRQLLPTTIIEERVRGSRGSLDSIGTGTQSLNSPTSTQQNFITNINNNNNNNIHNSLTDINSPKDNSNCNQNNSDSDSTNMESKCDSNPSSRSSSRVGFINGRDNNYQKTTFNSGNDCQNKSANESSPNQKVKSSHKQSSSPNKTKGVPQSFGYIKRTNGSALGVVTTTTTTAATTTADQQKMIQQQQQQQLQQQLIQQDHNRTALVSGVPRNGKIKVSGGTQTEQNEIQPKMPPPPTNQNRSFSLTGPGATQLSLAIRERLANGSYSLPKPGSEMHMFQHRVKYRHSGKILDGSLSDTQTYAEVKPEQSTYAMWLKHSNTTSSRLSAGDSIESLQHVLGSPAMQRHSAHKLIHRSSPSNQLTANGAVVEAAYIQSPRLNRSNSIRSSKSDKMYSTLSSNQSGEVDIEPFYCLPVGSIQSQIQNGMVTGGNLVRIAPWSQPTSPTPPTGRGSLLSPTHSGICSSGYNSITPSHRLTYPKRNDDVHGSTASLLSGGSSLYGSVEERQANEVRRLKRELVEAREQVMSLSSQLSTNAHVVSAFEQSLTNMKQRLQHLTETTERKDGELTDMRQTIELLRKQSIQAGLTSAHMQSMGLPSQGNTDQMAISPRKQNNCSENIDHGKKTANGGTNLTTVNRNSTSSNLLEVQQNHSTRGSVCSLNSIGSVCSATQDKKKKKSWLKSSFTKAFSKNAKISKTEKHASSIPNTPQKLPQHRVDNTNSTSKQISSGGNLSVEDQKIYSNICTPSNSTKSSPQKCVTIIENAKPLDAIDLDGNPVVENLKKQLREKDLILTDIRLEALSSASQLESLRDTVMKMRTEMLTLKQNNERLQKLVTSRSLAGSEISLRNSTSPNGSIISDSKRYSLVDGNRPHIELPKSLEEEVEEDNITPGPAPEPPPPSTLPIKTTSPTTHIDLTPPPPAIEAPSPTRSQPPMLPSVSEDGTDVTDGKRIEIAVYLGQSESFPKYLEEIMGGSKSSEVIYSNTNFHKDSKETDEIYSNATTEMEERMYSNPNFHEFVIACTYISGKTTWQNLDYIVRKTFKDYLARIDSGTNLGLNTDSIMSYHLGEAKRGPEIGFPQLLPCGYIIGNVKTLYICLQGVGSLAFDSLIPRSIVHRYITLLTEHRRLILCGPSGTGKSYLARKLAEFLVARSGRCNISEAIATFNVDNKSSKELRQFLNYIGEQASMLNGESELPSVIILDNLHHASALGDVFSSLLSSGPAAKLPCIIGTMSQATCNTTNLQLHHNFRWVLTANHMEPVKGFLGRYLKRRLYTLELHSQKHQPELTAVFAWLPTVWQHINRFLEIHSSSDVTIGPRLFLSCPLNLKDSQVWFTDIWNYHIVPYLIEAVREGVQLYGRRGGAWNDPSTFIRDTYPWKYGPDSVPPLRQINAEDVGLEGCEIGKSDSHDPLLNMLMHLQEAANYSENQEPESDCVSLDSNLTQDSSVGVENEGE